MNPAPPVMRRMAITANHELTKNTENTKSIKGFVLFVFFVFS